MAPLDGTETAAQAWVGEARRRLAHAESFHASCQREVARAEAHLAEVRGSDSGGITRAHD